MQKLIKFDIFISMNLNEEIRRIKVLMLENSDPYTISTSGNINNAPGLHISIHDGDTKMGHTNLINFDDANVYDYDVPRFMSNHNEYCHSECSENFFHNGNNLYMHDLKVFDDFKGKGLSHNLMDECHRIAKESGVDYVTLITGRDNTVAQNLYKKHGYQLYQTDGIKDFFFRPL